MKDIGAGLRHIADLAERAAVAAQHAELDRPRLAPAIIGGLEMTADLLRHAARPLGPPPVASRRELALAALMIGVQMVVWVAVLSVVPDPAAPVVLAATLAGSMVPAKLTRDLVAALWDRRTRQLLGTDTARDAGDAILDLRTRIGAVIAALEPDRDDVHLEVGRRIDRALEWLDAADDAVAAAAGFTAQAG